MKINHQTTIQDLFNYFTGVFPYLKVEVYKKAHQLHKGSPIADQLPHHLKLIDINPDLKTEELNIEADMKVSEFENMMAEKLNVNIQVFRKSNEIWLQTSVTDDWTLEKQNGKGERSMQQIYPDAMEEPMDVDRRI
ncbi:MAG: hypothetical protein IPM42_16990 [Saprospiraceae bacterium]|nr:hypothetical protein [Saprospiraceae bacterium]